MGLKGILKDKHVYICGGKKNGKTTFIKWFLSGVKKHMVFDPRNEYNGFHRFRPTKSRGPEAIKQLGYFYDEIVKPNQVKLDAIAVDEVNRFHNKGGTLKGPMGELVDFGSSGSQGKPEERMSTIFVSRKPQQVHTDVRGMAEVVIIFKLYDVGAIDLLNNMVKGKDIELMIRNLGKYEFLVIDRGGASLNIQSFNPVDLQEIQKV